MIKRFYEINGVVFSQYDIVTLSIETAKQLIDITGRVVKVDDNEITVDDSDQYRGHSSRIGVNQIKTVEVLERHEKEASA